MRHRGLWGIAAVAFWMAACRWMPGLAAHWRGAATAALQALNRGTSALPFPVLEPMALGAVCLSLGRGGRKRLAAALMIAAGVYAALWYPLYFAEPMIRRPEPDVRALESLCEDLVNAPDASEADLPPDGGDGAKLARYPEWMAALGISGLFSPWTGEVILDPGLSPAFAPFTRVHESMHLRGVADEGAANIAAYVECMERGGAYADSARLWALRYALGALARRDGAAYQRALDRLPPALTGRLQLRDVEKPVRAHPLARLLGIAFQTTDYDALVRWLAEGEHLD